jgi:hypothetical protein
MKTIAVLAFSCAFSGMAFAQAPECQPTPGAGDLLACYNRTEPAPAPRQPATTRVRAASARPATSSATAAPDEPAISRPPTDRRARVEDILEDENKKLDAKVKSLCRGC